MNDTEPAAIFLRGHPAQFVERLGDLRSRRAGDDTLDIEKPLESPSRGYCRSVPARRLTTVNRLVTYSPKVFVPVTRFCRDVCQYGALARPRRGDRAYLTCDEVLAIARAGAEAGCHDEVNAVVQRATRENGAHTGGRPSHRPVSAKSAPLALVSGSRLRMFDSSRGRAELIMRTGTLSWFAVHGSQGEVICSLCPE